MELFGTVRDFHQPQGVASNRSIEQPTTPSKKFNTLIQQRMKAANSLGLAIVQWRQLKAKLLELATPRFLAAQEAFLQGNHEDFQDLISEIEYWEHFGEGKIYKAMICQAKMTAQRWHETYKESSAQLESLAAQLTQMSWHKGHLYPNQFLNFERFEALVDNHP